MSDHLRINTSDGNKVYTFLVGTSVTPRDETTTGILWVVLAINNGIQFLKYDLLWNFFHSINSHQHRTTKNNYLKQ